MKKSLRALFVVVVGLMATTVVDVPEPSSAVSGSQFDPGYIISDAAFFDSSSMSENDIQQFLERMVPTCAASAGRPCLKNYSEATISRAPVATNHCGPYAGSPNERASAIIFKVAQACNISPKVLLATLQKERGLVTKSSPTAADYTVAMGFGCPDTAPCATEYYGFGNQMYLAARQFRQYTYRPASYNFRTGAAAVQFHPNINCGRSTVNIRNQATANLYNYTPYQPNAAALANLNGSGDGCSSYGNRNFWNYYYSWFGNPAFSEDPRASLDESSVDYTVGGAFIHLRGWAFDPSAPSAPMDVHVYLTQPDGSVTGYPVAATASRPDVGNAYPGAGSAHGFTLDVRAEAVGSYRSCMYLMRAAGPVLFGCQFFVVTQDAPSGALDATTVNFGTAPGSVDIRGWAIDDIAPRRVADVHVYLSGPGGFVSTFVVPANQSRPDVAIAYPAAGAGHGFSLSAPLPRGGNYRVCAYAIGTPVAGPNNQTLGCSSFTFGPSGPVGSVDSVSVDRVTRTITVTGWALDSGARDRSTQAHVYVTGPDGRASGVAVVAAESRDDVARAYQGAGSNHGFTAKIAVASDGVYRMCAYSIGAPTFGSTNSLLRCTDVRVGVGQPTGSLDSVSIEAGQITSRGWALDLAVPVDQTDVHVYVTGAGGARSGYVTKAAETRSDVGAAFLGAGPNHGFALSVPRNGSGPFTVCAYAIASLNAGTGNTLIGCGQVG